MSLPADAQLKLRALYLRAATWQEFSQTSKRLARLFKGQGFMDPMIRAVGYEWQVRTMKETSDVLPTDLFLDRLFGRWTVLQGKEKTSWWMKMTRTIGSAGGLLSIHGETRPIRSILIIP